MASDSKNPFMKVCVKWPCLWFGLVNWFAKAIGVSLVTGLWMISVGQATAQTFVGSYQWGLVHTGRIIRHVILPAKRRFCCLEARQTYMPSRPIQIRQIQARLIIWHGLMVGGTRLIYLRLHRKIFKKGSFYNSPGIVGSDYSAYVKDHHRLSEN